jgi:3-phenylpropionate/trans-cinnamate dioxygenase ferredoxin reductase subunit
VNTQDPVVIVGAGQAGAHAAVTLRQSGFPGRIVLIGEEAARPHERPPLSKAVLTAEHEPAISYFHPDEHYAEQGIETLLETRVEGIDPAGQVVHLTNGGRQVFSNLLLATGGQARRLTVPGADGVLYLRTLDDARLLRAHLRPGARIVCIGAGVIGLEIASSARTRGCEVTVIEAGTTVMGRSLPAVLAEWLSALHIAAGVDLRLGTEVQAIVPTGVVCGNGTFIPADVVVAGIGMVRNTGLAQAAGLAVDNGIEVDEFCRTSVPGIYAAGDVAAFWVPRLGRRLRLETWRHAQDHGIAAGQAIAGQGAPYDTVPWFWTDQHGRNLQVAGELSESVVLRGEPGAGSFSAWFLDRARVLKGVAGVDSPREVRVGQALIRTGRSVDPALLADRAVTPKQLMQA